MRTEHTKLAVWSLLFLVAFASADWRMFRGVPPPTGNSAAIPVPDSKAAGWTGRHPGASDWFLVNPVYPPQVAGRYDQSGRTTSPGAKAAAPATVLEVHPTFPPQVVGVRDPLSRADMNRASVPSPPLRPDPPVPDVKVGKDAEGRVTRFLRGR